MTERHIFGSATFTLRLMCLLPYTCVCVCSNYIRRLNWFQHEHAITHCKSISQSFRHVDNINSELIFASIFMQTLSLPPFFHRISIRYIIFMEMREFHINCLGVLAIISTGSTSPWQGIFNRKSSR